MAGTCVAPLGGLTTVGGALSVSGARTLAWPGAPGSCRIEDMTGLKIDPTTGKLWTSPDVKVFRSTGTQDGANRLVSVTDGGGSTILLSSLAVEMTAPPCGRSMFVANLHGGYMGLRCAAGNFWAIRRYISGFIDGTPIGFSGLEDVGGLENSTAGVIGTAGPVESTEIYIELTPGQKGKVVAYYQIELLNYAANVVNSVSWRTPVLQGVIWNIPTP